MGEEAQKVQYIPMNIPVPVPMSGSGNIAANWKKFKRSWDTYEVAARLGKEGKEIRTATFLTCIGTEMQEVYDSLHFTETEDKNDITVVLKKFETYCVGETNEIYERYCFNQRVQEPNEPIDSYLSALRSMAKTCNYGNLEDNLIRDRLVIGIRDNATRKRLLQEPKLTLNGAVDICRAGEATSQQLKAMTQEDVHVVSKKTTPKSNNRWRERKPPGRNATGSAKHDSRQVQDCSFCGLSHAKNKCPAYGQTCNHCGKKNHFALKCIWKQKGKHSVKLLADTETTAHPGDRSGIPEEYIDHIDVAKPKDSRHTGSPYPKKIFATLRLNNKDVTFLVDLGATTNTLPVNMYKNIYCDTELSKVESSSTTLITYDNTTIASMGKCRMQVINPKNGKRYSVGFELTPDHCKPVMGARASQHMQLVTVNFENILAVTTDNPAMEDEILRQYPEVFQGEGSLPGKLHLQVDETVEPVQIPVRRVPLALKDRVKAELDRLTETNIITPVDEPTKWISSMVAVTKKSGDIRLCIDPKPLNAALKRNHYPPATIDDVLPELAEAKVFSVLDTRNAFWHVELEHKSSFLTTFGTPWGRYRWLRMPFGISVATEEFQRRLHVALEGLCGSKAIADDILVWGKGSDVHEATKDHDRNLKLLLERCSRKGIRLNSTKIRLRLPEVAFMGHLLTNKGLKADPAKLEAVSKMPIPKDKQEVLRFLGMMNYLSKFIPQLSELCAPLRQLTQKENSFTWVSSVHTPCFERMKSVLMEAPVLKYFDPKEGQIVLQCDASQYGLGACLMQNQHPVAYASRALSTTECHYAQIEKELLAIVFGMEKFQEYVYGRKIKVETDHKPLESIARKSLLNTPKRLQRMLLRLQKYDIDVVYRKGCNMELADTLSRAFLPAKSDVRSPTEMAAEHINALMFVPLSDDALSRIRIATEADAQLQQLSRFVRLGWPGKAQSLPSELQQYFPFRDELVLFSGILLKGERVIVPHSLRHDLIEKIHSSHIGMQGCIRRARESLYWPGMYQDIVDRVSRCEVCQRFQCEQSKEPMIAHEPSKRPWEKIACDLFHLEGEDYLLTVDYYSSFVEVDKLRDKKSGEVISLIKTHMSRHGIPDCLFSDNGPPFNSEDFRNFTKVYNFEHVTSSPRYPQSNGKAENAVKTVKLLLKKARASKSDPHLALLDWRNTPSEGLGNSPAQRLFSRRCKTRLPIAASLLQPSPQVDVPIKLESAKIKQAFYYNRGSKELPSLTSGTPVNVKLAPNQTWQKGSIDDQVDVRSYTVRTEDGRVLRRNRKHIRQSTHEPVPANVMPDPDIPNTPVTPQLSPPSPPRMTEPQARAEPRTSSGRTIRVPGHLKDFVLV